MAIVNTSQVQAKVPVTVFQLQDRINLGNAAEMEKAAQDAYEKGARNLVIDMSLVPSITSAGIRSLVTIFKLYSTEEKKRVKLAGLSKAIREILDIAGITQQIEVYNTVDEAAETFQ